MLGTEVSDGVGAGATVGVAVVVVGLTVGVAATGVDIDAVIELVVVVVRHVVQPTGALIVRPVRDAKFASVMSLHSRPVTRQAETSASRARWFHVFQKSAWSERPFDVPIILSEARL